MTISEVSVVRPVATTVFMLLLIVFGVISLNRMAVREYPDIDVPTISIDTTYDGASSSVMETKITQRIEDAVAGIEGLDTISSISRDGRSRVTLEFKVERDIDAAANDVRDKVSRILKKLPDGADSPVVAKYDSSGSPVVILALTSPNMTRMQLTDYADRYLVDRFSVIDGVANVSILGAQEQSMRIWLDRKAMAARGVTVSDIESTLNAENVENPGGRIESADREFTVRLNRQYATEEDFRNMVIKRDKAGDYVRLSDVALVKVDSRRPRQNFMTNKEPMVGLGVYKQSKSNALVISKGVRQLAEELNKSGLPKGMSLRIIRDEALFINASIREVRDSLVISAILVLLIIFLFLGNLRASMIPAVTVPLSLISTFIVLYALGYSVNLLTLLALVLAIGMVVDDAIVMLENIYRRISLGEKPLLAATRGANQVIMAVIATTLVLAAVFMPISLWSGKTGKLFTEFAVAMTSAVVFSSCIALTLTPMLCSKLLRKKEEREKSRLIRMVDFVMHAMENGYDKALRFVASYKILAASFFAAVCILTVAGWRMLPSEYEPTEDRGVIMTRIIAPEGTNYYAINDYADRVANVLYQPVLKGLANSLMVVIPTFGESDGAANTGFCILELKPWDQRTQNSQSILNKLRPELQKIPHTDAIPYLPSGLGGFGTPVQFVIGGPEYEELVKWRNIILEKCRSYPGIVDIDYDYKETTPQLHVEVNRKRANELGISAKAIGDTLEIMLGSKQITTYVDRGQEYDVMLQAGHESRATPSDLSSIYVRAKYSGELVPLDNLVTIRERGDSGVLGRYNRVRAITIRGNVAPGYALSDVLTFLENTVHENLPEYAQIGYKNQSKELKRTSGSMMFVFVLALLVSYLALCAQFESFISPLVVMLTVPLGMIGAIASLNLLGFTMNIYTQIGIIMLIGLAAKNGILIVEFANQLRDEGVEFTEALFSAAKLRIRPILMTGISTVAGAVPLLLATGAGAASRRCLGAVVVYGGLSACLLTLFVVPIGYLIFARWESSPKAIQRRLEQENRENPETVH